jgi:hypothetical protein
MTVSMLASDRLVAFLIAGGLEHLRERLAWIWQCGSWVFLTCGRILHQVIEKAFACTRCWVDGGKETSGVL